jgi:hypothetical protein
MTTTPAQVHARIARGVQYANLIQQAAEAARTGDVFAGLGKTAAASECRTLANDLREAAALLRGGAS